MAGEPTDPEPASSVQADYAAAFDTIWELVHENFLDERFNGCDWSAARERYRTRAVTAGTASEFSNLVGDMLAELNTSHTRLYTRRDQAFYFLLDLFKETDIGKTVRKTFPNETISYVGIGVFTTSIDGNTFVAGVVDGGPADLAGLKLGDQVRSVEGRPFEAVASFQGREGQRTRLTIQTQRDPASIAELFVTPVAIEPVAFYLAALRKSVRIIERSGRKIGYVRMWSYAGRANHEALQDEVRNGLLSQSDALIVDLRDGWGGANPDYLNLFNHEVPVITSIGRDGGRHQYDTQWRKPVALLVNEGTRSGKEIIAYAFRKHGYGPVIGTRTAGAVTGGRIFRVNDDAILYLAVADALIDGERLEGRGVAPDFTVPFTLPYAHGNDPQLAKAIEVLLKAVN
jgi:carboxyl-terminal processing protease